jgi:hypothetical protein
MNSPGLGLDTGPRRRKTTHMQAKDKSEVETNEVYSLSNWYKISVRSGVQRLLLSELVGNLHQLLNRQSGNSISEMVVIVAVFEPSHKIP